MMDRRHVDERRDVMSGRRVELHAARAGAGSGAPAASGHRSESSGAHRGRAVAVVALVSVVVGAALDRPLRVTIAELAESLWQLVG
jgi:hypothetical protein